MFIDISKPPPALPQPHLQSLGQGLSLLPPVSRKGEGPGLIILVPNTTKSTAIEDGVPGPALKWAEESYTVVEIQEDALEGDIAGVLKTAIEAVTRCDKCRPAEKIGLVAYYPALWNKVADVLPEFPNVVAAVIYGEVSGSSTISSSSIPQVQHLAGRTAGKPSRTNALTAYEYPSMKSGLFAFPFQDEFNYAQEAVSHTRNLTFLKKVMGGPYFDLEELWDEHTYFEFENRSVEWTMSTMVQEPYVNHIPTLTGGIGREKLSHFYANHFIFKNSATAELELTSRTVGIDRVIDEFIFKFVHDSEMDWLIPGIPPTGQHVQVPMTAVVNIRGDRLYHEHIAWDQGTVLKQLGLLPDYLPFPYALPGGQQPGPGKVFKYKLPIAGIQTAEKMRNKNSVNSNELFEFKVKEVDK